MCHYWLYLGMLPLKVAASRIPLLESDLATKDVVIVEFKNQLSEISVQNNELKTQIHEQQLEFARSTAVLDTQKMILTELQGHLGIKKKEESVTSALK
ncbi:hypothetical protein [Undibacterium danionis]|jgi:hypothetical protein|uniref:Uncharacterized protein n=1 Tax=Undibacterium danionis TaxID=1812100 RepID=A0ABV6IK64_9BURK